MTVDGPVDDTSNQTSEKSDILAESPDDVPDKTKLKLRQLHDVTREMMAADSKEGLFHAVTEAATELLDFDYNTIRRYESETEQLAPVAVSEPLRSNSGNRRRYDRGETIQWEAIDEQEIQVFQRVSEIDDNANRSGDGSMLIIPLNDFGVLTLGSPETRSITESDIELARVFGANIETAIDRVERLETLRQRESELTQRAQQVTVLNRGLRHNIRNELNVLMGWLDKIDRAIQGKHREDIERSLQAARDIGSLAEQARNIQKMLSEDHDTVEHELVAVTRSQVARARAEFPDVSFDAEFPASAPVLAIDCIREAVWEGVENAVVHNDSDQPRVSLYIDSHESETTWQLTIADNGPGIPRQEQKVLSREEENQLEHGSGLGLWYLKWLVDQSHGTLQFGESPFDSGTALQIRLPAAPTKPDT
jgi:signal transduction histidine kinase